MSIPGGPISTRPLHFIWLLDCSGSMKEDGKIQSLNNAISESIPGMIQIADENPNAELLIRVVTFSDGAQWLISKPTPIKEFKWKDIAADGQTDMGKAFSLVADQLKVPPMNERALPPVIVLISDGHPTDDYSSGLKKLLEQLWGKHAVKISIAIGSDVDLEVLKKFMDNSELKPLIANSADQLTKYIKWASTVPIKASSSPASTPVGTKPNGNVHIPDPPPPSGKKDDDKGIVW